MNTNPLEQLAAFLICGLLGFIAAKIHSYNKDKEEDKAPVPTAS